MSDASPPNKKDLARALLLRGSLFVHLDPRAEGVVVPNWLKKQPQLVLQVGLDMPVPVPDLRVDDAGVFATLSFNRSPVSCMVPWHAVFAMVGDDGKGMVWPESMPEEIASEVEREARRRGRGQLKLTESEDRTDSGEPHDGDRSEQRPSDRGAGSAAPALRRVPPPELSLVPSGSPPPASERLHVVKDAQEGSEGDDTPQSPTPKPPAGKKKSRGLPPYLRVVK